MKFMMMTPGLGMALPPFREQFCENITQLSKLRINMDSCPDAAKRCGSKTNKSPTVFSEGFFVERPSSGNPRARRGRCDGPKVVGFPHDERLTHHTDRVREEREPAMS